MTILRVKKLKLAKIAAFIVDYQISQLTFHHSKKAEANSLKIDLTNDMHAIGFD